MLAHAALRAIASTPEVSPFAAKCLPTSRDTATLSRMVPSDAILTHLRRGALEYCVLAMLNGDPLYGLDIARRLTADGVLLASEGTLYPMLARLRRSGLVTTTWEESSEGPPRRYYSLTPEGSAALRAFRETWPPFRDAVDAVLDTTPNSGAAPS